ncbi:MAG: ABC transporter ATP-binding protein [bacterium]
MNDIQLKNLFFSYQNKDDFSLQLNSFTLKENSQIFIEGPSGCGKTTFLNIVTGLIKPQSGQVTVLGKDLTTCNKVECDRFRADNFGIIFQMFNLIPYLNVIENITLPCMFSKIRKQKTLEKAASLEEEALRLCRELDIEEKVINKPVHQLSIGQQQRVSIARAVIGEPKIIIADEATSALDNKRKQQFMETLFSECQKYQASLIFVSHDLALQSQFKEKYCLNEMNLKQNKKTHVAV